MNRHLFITVLNQVAVGGLLLNLAPVTSELVQELGATYTGVGLVTTMFLLGQAVTCLPAGYLCDRFGVKWIYIGANVGILLVVVLLGTASGMVQILVMRCFLGLLVGTQFIAGSSYLAFWSPRQKATLYQGIYGGGFNFGITLSFFLTAPQVYWFGWRGVFLIPGILCFISTLWILAWCREPPEKPAAQPIPLKRIRDLPMGGLTLLGVSMTTAWVTFILLGAWLTEYLRVERQSVLWLSAALTGINVAGSGIGRVVGGMVTKPGRERLAIIWFYGLVTVMAACLFFPAPPMVILTLAFFVVAVTSMGFAPTVRLTFQIAGSDIQGTAVGYVLTLAMVFGSVLPPLFGWLVESSESFVMGFLVVLACPLAGFLAMLKFQSRTESR